jgi:hypothetical protein
MKRWILTALLGAGCAGETYVEMDGIGATHVVDGDGAVTEVVATMDKAELATMIADEQSGQGFAEFDDVVRDATVFDHVGCGYNAHGHGPPGVNDIPHIDAHFYMLSMADREAIDCEGEPVPDAAQVPEGVEANVNKEPFGGCVAAMGGHGSLPYTKLTADMIYGYHDGKMIFVEPMIDVAMLQAEDEIELDVLAPAELAFEGAYPQRLFVRYTDEAYEFVMTDFTTLE